MLPPSSSCYGCVVTPTYLGWGVLSRSVLFHFTYNILFVPQVERRNLGFVWVCTQIVGSVVLCEFAPLFFKFPIAVTHRLSAYRKLHVPMWRGWSLVYMLKRMGDRTLLCGKPFLCFLYLLHSLFNSTSYLLLDSIFWITLHSGLS